MKLAVPDMISNSYIAAIELGFFGKEGLDVELELIFPVDKAYAALRLGAVDFVGGSEVVKGRSIGAAPWVDMGLHRLLIEAGFDLDRDRVKIAPVLGATGQSVNFGLTAARALEDRKIDGFWANGMGAEVAVRRGAGTVVVDVRRGDGPKSCFDYTMASIATSDRLIERSPTAAPAAVRAIAGAHAALKKDVTLASKIGHKLFPPTEAELIAELIRRDLPYYDTTISPDFVTRMNQFARDVGILSGDVPCQMIVAKAN